MLDYNARQIIASRTIEDRHAEARRAHLLREARADIQATAATSKVETGPSLVDRLLTGIAQLRNPLVARPALR